MSGHTLIELVFVLLLLGVAATSVAPAARRARDHAAVTGAREALVGLLAEARATAVESGAASVRISRNPWRAEVMAAGARLRTLALASDFGVSLELSGDEDEVVLRFDALGLGRVASQTVVFRRNEESAELVISSYGRVRRG